MTEESLLTAIRDLYENRYPYIAALSKSEQKDSIRQVMNVILGECRV